MKKLVFVLALIAVSAHAQFYTNTYNYNGRTVTCTTSCINGQNCTTSCF